MPPSSKWRSDRTSPERLQPVDAVVIGMGASGATAAKVLTEAGLTVVGLDRGPHLEPGRHFSGDELKFVNRNYLGPDPALNPRTVRTDQSARATVRPFSPTPQTVGGGTVHWGGWLPRPMPSDFRQRSRYGDIVGASLADWPIDYSDLEPYLTKVEWEFGVCGLASANKYEPPRSRDYPMPPLPPTPFAVRFYEGCAKLGINSYPIPHALVSASYRNRQPANHTGFWGQFGDPTNMRSTTLTTFVPEALATGRLDLRPNCYVREITVRTNGAAKGVVYLDQDGREVEQEAKAVILCLGAIESARLLLLSRSNRFPDGLANSSGQVGKNATFHQALIATGLFDRESTPPLHGAYGHDISGGTLEFYETDEARGHIGGCLVAATQTGPPVNWRLPGRPRWGLAAKEADRAFFDHALALMLIVQDLPVDTNRVDLDPDVTDAWGLPVARITHKHHPNDVSMANWQMNKNVEILEAAGAMGVRTTALEDGVSTTFHQHGTARMGRDSDITVLDQWCRAHEVPNLYVFDGSGFPTATGVTPSLMIMANAWRCAEHLVHAGPEGAQR